MSTNLANKRVHDNLSKDAVVRARVSLSLKSKAEDILNDLGITMSEAINLYLSQIKLNNGIPFDIKIPNKETAKAIREARVKKGVVICKNADDMFKKLGI